MEEVKEFWDAGNEIDRCNWDPPRQCGPERRAHAKANHQHPEGPMVERRQGEVRHHLGDRAQVRHTDPVDQKLLCHPRPVGSSAAMTVAVLSRKTSRRGNWVS